MDDTDKQLLNIIQTDFPICPRPYEALGGRLGISEDEAFARVRAMVASGVIRRLGAAFDTRKLGHTSALVAAKAPKDRLPVVADIVSSYPQVTHNYGRDHEYNLWFALICRDTGEIERVVDEIKARTGVSEIHILPATRMFKLRVEFEF